MEHKKGKHDRDLQRIDIVIIIIIITLQCNIYILLALRIIITPLEY